MNSTRHQHRRLAFAAIFLAALITSAIHGESPQEKFFRESVQPILVQHCYKCHSHASGMAKGGLVLDARSGWSKGGDSGPAIFPGKPDQSLLIQAVRYGDLEMPPTGKLPGEAIAILERWVADGAADPRISDPVTTTAAMDLEAARKHWAFQPIRNSPVPQTNDPSWPRTDIDRFLLAKLEQAHLRPVADADRYTWLRRVTLDLTGLPPTLEEIEQFVNDPSPEAAERVVDRLLSSRAYGERWARHWLDLVGYADQIGTANDVFAEHAWRYRDYVIDSFQRDKPLDQFIREQIAGDLLPYTSPQERAEQIVATGFLLLGDLTIVEADKAKLRVDVVDQQVDKVSRAFLGMTVACARCHDHKFDPISQRDYYALAGIFNSTESITRAEWGVWSWPAVANLPETEQQQTARTIAAERHRQKLESLKAERERLVKRKAEVDQALANTPAPSAGATADPTHSVLLKIQQEIGQRVAALDREILHAEFFAPVAPRAFAVRDVAEPNDMQITIRGNPHALGDKVPRGFFEVVSYESQPPIPTNESGRRQLADWIASSQNPLTARVIVNRVWSKLFGEGLVRSVDYFGLPSDPPTHPELLDHLAHRFVSGGWSQRQLIRSIVLSRAYGMNSIHDDEALKTDPANHLVWRMNSRRLDAESLRDAMLSVSGRLISSDGGPSLPLEFPENTGNLHKGSVNPPSFQLSKFRLEQSFERTIYLPIIRSGPQAGSAEILNVFDFTQPAEFAGKRSITAVPTQALFLMNSQMIKQRSRDLAERVLQADLDDSIRLERLWLRTFNRMIEPSEKEAAVEFLKETRAGGTTDQADAEGELKAWTELCHSILASNEFLIRL